MTIRSTECNYWKDVQEVIPFADAIPQDLQDSVSLWIQTIHDDATYQYAICDSNDFIGIELNRTHPHRRAEIVDEDTNDGPSGAKTFIGANVLRTAVLQMSASKAHELYSTDSMPRTTLAIAKLVGADNITFYTGADNEQAFSMDDDTLASSLARSIQRQQQREALGTYDPRDTGEAWSFSVDLTNPEVIERALTPVTPPAIYLPDSPVWQEAHFPAGWDGRY